MCGASKRGLIALFAAGITGMACAGVSGQVVVVMDQIGTGPGDIINGGTDGCQDFEAGFDAYDIATLDDFTLTSAQHLSKVEALVSGWNGFTNASYASITAYRVEIYSSPAAAAVNLTGDVKSWIAPLGSVLTNDNGGAGYGGLPNRLVTITLPPIGDAQAIDLPVGTYWIAVIPVMNFAGIGQCGIVENGWGGAFPAGGDGQQANPNGGFAIPGNLQSIAGNAGYRVIADNGAVPTDPTGIGSVTPTPVEQGASEVFKVQVSPGEHPNSTLLAVTVNMSTLTGGAAAQTFYDDGPGGGHGDAVAGDNTFSYQMTIDAAQTLGPYSLPFHVQDFEGRFMDGTINFTVLTKSWNEAVDGGGDAGDLPLTAQVCVGVGPLNAIVGNLEANGVDMYKINICDINTFSATLGGGSTADTQLWLFNLDGTGRMFNDDFVGTQSTINNTGGLLTDAGDYYLAVTLYDHDAVDGGALELWADTPFGTIRFPDGPGAANAVAAWNGTTAAGGAYRITLVGVCHTDPLAPTPPTGSPSASYSGLLTGGTPVVLRVATTGGTNPASIGIAVTGDFAVIGGSNGQTMFDDGPGGGHGDLVAGDGTFSFSLTLPGAQPAGSTPVTFHVSDSNSARNTAPVLVLSVVSVTDLGTVVGPSDVVSAVNIPSANYIQWFKFTIGNEVSDATTYYLDIDTTDDGIFTGLDTEIGVYRSDGTANTNWNDDDSGNGLYSALSYGATTPTRDYSLIGAGDQIAGNGRTGVLTAGTYYLATGMFNVNYGLTGFGAVGTSAATGSYKLNLRSNLPGAPLACSPADLVDGLGVPPGDGFVTGTDADFFVQAYNTLSQRPNGSYYADLTDGFGGGPDGFVTGTDADYFTEKYFLGC